ncbi:MAG: hypothetical protein COX81_01010 [Candidatus Magasanikbacteria bacterium CG_4_10_14_0_2_um_filter_37_12]|uniref:Uncharacterized protein n=1 Tax=Candidatus Magasanikbacteria bacterium CG_4_10_14_0_2_um_filter_37_12 TaxID=1974637 RepID=A0A2M7V9D5_9BACT|nr:MAG: hypothetical protein COX81_01010 [Candidatus Magasanikbacteria bacterium CG_4_10_14_0_2_um_filter_37_12]
MKTRLFNFNKCFVASILAVFVLFFLVSSTEAGNLGDDIAAQVKAGASAAELKAVPPQFIIVDIINIALSLIGIIFISLAIYAGYLRFIAHGAEEDIKKSNEVLIAAFIGVIVVFMAFAITKFVAYRVQNAVFLEDAYEVNDYYPNNSLEVGVIL